MKASPDRRRNPDRRRHTSRRRYTDARSLHIELCHSLLRVALVTDEDPGQPPRLKAFSMRWRQEAESPTSELGRAELAAALGQLVSEQRLTGCVVSLAISSTLCVNRAVSGATARVEQEVAYLKERSQLYLALGPGPKTAAVARRDVDARHEHALITVTNQRTLDVLVHAAEMAGLSVRCVESALVSLSRLHGALGLDKGRAVILAQIDEERFEVGVSRDGQLLVEYRPSTEATARSLGRVIDDHHERLERFCARQYGVGAMTIDRMWLVGEADEITLTDVHTDVGVTTAVLPVEDLQAHWRLDDDSEFGAEMGPALGLAFRDRLDVPSVCPNLMEEVLARAKQPIKPFLLKAAIPLAVTLLVATSLWAYNLSNRYELAELNSRLDQARPALLEEKRLSALIRKQAAESEQLTRLAEQTPKARVGELVKRVGHLMPEGVWLKGLRLVGGEQLLLNGLSNSESSVYTLVRHLEESPDFREVALRGTGLTSVPEGLATSFDIEITLAPQAPEGGNS